MPMSHHVRPEIRFLDRGTPPHIVTLVMVAGLSALAMNIFLPSLPGMTEWFATDYRLMQLSVSLYLAASAALQVVIGPISDRFGRRSVLLWSVGLFLFATLGTLLAPNVGVFLVFRMMQAVVAAGMVLSRAVIRDMVPGEQAASMIARTCMRTSAGRWIPSRTPRSPSIGFTSRIASTAASRRFFCASVPASPSGSAPAAIALAAIPCRVSSAVTSRNRSS